MNPWVNFIRLMALYRLLTQISPTLIHAITIKPNLFVGLLSYGLKTPYILSVTGTGIIFSGKTRAMKMARPCIRLLYKLPRYNKTKRKIIFENAEDRDYFINQKLCSADEAVTILGAGVDIDLYQATEPNPAGPVTMLFAARLLWDKGLGDLIEACRLLRQRGLDFILQVAGIIDNDVRDAIDIRILEGWQQEGIITWLGTETNMPKRLANTDIVVLPTFYGEGIPRILIEAAACARPIVTTDTAGCREIVKNGDNGFLVPPRNIDSLATALERLLQAPELRKQMGLNGRKKVERYFCEKKVIDETMSLYNELLQ